VTNTNRPLPTCLENVDLTALWNFCGEDLAEQLADELGDDYDDFEPENFWRYLDDAELVELVAEFNARGSASGC